MSPEDQDAIIGKAHREYAEAKKELAALQIRLDNIAAAASNLARALADPSHMAVPGDGEAVVGPAAMTWFIFTDEVGRQLSRDYVGKNVKEYKAARQRVSGLRQQLLSLGQPVD